MATKRRQARRGLGLVCGAMAFSLFAAAADAPESAFMKTHYCARAEAADAATMALVWRGGAFQGLREAMIEERKTRCETKKNAPEIASDLLRHCRQVCPSVAGLAVDCESVCGVYGALDLAYLGGLSVIRPSAFERRPASGGPPNEVRRKKISGRSERESPRAPGPALSDGVNALLSN